MKRPGRRKMPEKYFSFSSALSDSWVLTKRSVTHIIRNPDQLMSLVITPIMFLLLFRYIFGGAINTGNTTYVNFLVAGILVQTLAFGASTTTLNIVLDLKRGIIDRFRSLPIFGSSLLIGHVNADLVRNLISGVILIAFSFLIGFRPNAGPVEWLLVFLLAMSFTLAVSWLSAILGLVLKSVEASQWATFVIILPLTFASSAFVPTEGMPYVLRVFAENQPFTRVIESIRSWLVGTPIGNNGIAAFIWCIAIIIVAIPVATWMFRRYKPSA
jgi:ABC-2 type transport system permease protein